MKTTADLFNFHFNSNKVAPVEFNPAWANGTGYYDYAVYGEHAPVLQVGQMVKCNTGGENNRNMLIVGTPIDNVVMFQRFTADDGVFVTNTSTKLSRTEFCPNGAVRLEQAERILGDEYGSQNIGKHLEMLKKLLS